MTDRTSDEAIPLTPRRTVLRGAVLAGVAVPFLVACSDDEPSSDGTTTTSSGSDDPTSPDDSSSPPESTDDGGGGGGGEAIASVSDVPEGGGLILDDPKIVITQPTAGEFLAFTSICTHMGCPVDNVTDGTINCTCHGSMYSIEDGSVVGGPAPEPLAEEAISVDGDDITLA